MDFETLISAQDWLATDIPSDDVLGRIEWLQKGQEILGLLGEEKPKPKAAKIRLKSGHVALSEPIEAVKSAFGGYEYQGGIIDTADATVSKGMIVGLRSALAANIGLSTVGEVQQLTTDQQNMVDKVLAESQAREKSINDDARENVDFIRIGQALESAGKDAKKQVESVINDNSLSKRERINLAKAMLKISEISKGDVISYKKQKDLMYGVVSEVFDDGVIESYIIEYLDGDTIKPDKVDRIANQVTRLFSLDKSFGSDMDSKIKSFFAGQKLLDIASNADFKQQIFGSGKSARYGLSYKGLSMVLSPIEAGQFNIIVTSSESRVIPQTIKGIDAAKVFVYRLANRLKSSDFVGGKLIPSATAQANAIYQSMLSSDRTRSIDARRGLAVEPDPSIKVSRQNSDGIDLSDTMLGVGATVLDSGGNSYFVDRMKKDGVPVGSSLVVMRQESGDENSSRLRVLSQEFVADFIYRDILERGFVVVSVNQ